MLVGAGVGVADSPSAVTDPATGLTSKSADLNGVINPGGLDTFWEFQWGTTTAYGQNTMASGPISGTNPNSVMAPISGLQPNTTYHFRLVAVQGAAGVSGQPTISGGNDMTFTTSGGSNSGGSKNKHSHAWLRSHTLSVHGGNALIPWGCSGTRGAVCRGQILLKARGKIGGKRQTVSCGAGTLIASPGTRHTVRAHLSQSCLTLLNGARQHRVGASLTAHFSQGTGDLKTHVALVLR